MVVFGSTKNCNLVEWTQERATRNCKAKDKAFGVRACPGRYQNRLEKSLANRFYSQCRSPCVYDIMSMITDAKGAFVYKKRKKCWRFVKKGKCFKRKSYKKAIQRAQNMCPAKVAPTGNPTEPPTGNPTSLPTGNPTSLPTGNPTVPPTGNPTSLPTGNPTSLPTGNPTVPPTGNPTLPPTGNPTLPPTENPTVPATNIPTRKPTLLPIGLLFPKKIGYVNAFDGKALFSAGSSTTIITGMHSVHDNGTNDRKFGFYTKAAKGFSCLREGWNPFANNYDGKFRFECSTDKLIYAISSEHDNYKEDRRFQFRCCRLSKHVTTRADASFTGWQNSFDGALNFQCGESRALMGVSSEHSNYYEDRRFSFRCAKIIRR